MRTAQVLGLFPSSAAGVAPLICNLIAITWYRPCPEEDWIAFFKCELTIAYNELLTSLHYGLVVLFGSRSSSLSTTQLQIIYILRLLKHLLEVISTAY